MTEPQTPSHKPQLSTPKPRPQNRQPCHQQPEVNYLPCFENDDLPCGLHVFHVVCRVNHHSRNRVNSSLQVAGGMKKEKILGPHFTVSLTCYMVALRGGAFAYERGITVYTQLTTHPTHVNMFTCAGGSAGAGCRPEGNPGANEWFL